MYNKNFNTAMWVSCSIAIIVAIIITDSSGPLWAFLIPAIVSDK